MHIKCWLVGAARPLGMQKNVKEN